VDRERRRIIGEFIVLTIYLVLEVYGLWNISHFWTLFFAALGICALVFAEFPHKWFRIISGLTIAICAIIYYVAPPILPVETDIHGWLLPANGESPHECLKTPIPDTALLLLFGTNAVWTLSKEKVTVIQVSTCALMSFTQSPNGLLITGDVFDTSDELVARIVDNEFNLIPGKYAYQKRSEDRSVMTIFDKKGQQLLMMNFINKRTVDVQGRFICSDKTSVVITKNKISIHNFVINEFDMSTSCLGEFSPPRAALSIKANSLNVGGIRTR